MWLSRLTTPSGSGPPHSKEEVPQGACYFRREIELVHPVEGQIQITADDAYELYVNGRQVGVGANWRSTGRIRPLDLFDARQKRHRREGGQWQRFDRSPGRPRHHQRTRGNLRSLFHKHRLEDDALGISPLDDNLLRRRPMAKRSKLWRVRRTLPWGNEVQIAGAYGRFKTPPEFSVEWVIPPEETGSLIAMTFDERGRILASRKNGPLLLIEDSDADGVHDKTTVYCDKVSNCQGLLAINSMVLAISDGPDGAALYRLTDTNHDDKIDDVETLIKFPGPMREHGAHAIRLGPDGLVYIIIGNHTSVADQAVATSPSRPYEGDSCSPATKTRRTCHGNQGARRHDHANRHRRQLCRDVRRRAAQSLRHGLRPHGELFTHDADMESDEGTTWYRPDANAARRARRRVRLAQRLGQMARVFSRQPPGHARHGPRLADRHGRSTTTSCIPVRYHNAMFVGDWARAKSWSSR